MTEITAPAVVPNLPEAEYHAHPAVSKSGLWTIYTKTPSHFRHGERQEKREFALGHAAHCAILEPSEFEARFAYGPDDRRGNKWGRAQQEAADDGKELLTGKEYAIALRVRDAAAKHPILAKLAGQDVRCEESHFWHDARTKVLCRARPDMKVPTLALVVDLKTTTDASPRAFSRAVYEYGYHVQEAFYIDGIKATAKGSPFDAFCFAVIEKEPPFNVVVYELDPSVVAEGRAIYRKALDRYAECLRTDEWPGYAEEVLPLTFDRWQFRETKAPDPDGAAT